MFEQHESDLWTERYDYGSLFFKGQILILYRLKTEEKKGREGEKGGGNREWTVNISVTP